MPTRLRAAISRGVAAVALLLAVVLSAGPGSAFAAAPPVIHTGAIGGIAAPSGGSEHVLPDSEIFGGGGANGSSPGGGDPPLLYYGGPMMHAVTTQIIAWAPSGYSFPSGYVSGYEKYLSDMSAGLGLSSNISSIASQYLDASGPALSSLDNDAAISDTDAYPTSGCSVSGTVVCLTEAQIVTELAAVISANALSVDINHSYIVLLPPAVDTCFDTSSSECEDQAFCGYHTNVQFGTPQTTFTLLPYPESSYSNAPRGQCYDPVGPGDVSTALMAVDSIGAHELLESATDPLVGYGYVDAWGDEVADECAWTYGPANAATGGGDYNQLVNGDQYMIQEMWSNQANACAQGESTSAQASISTNGSPVINAPMSFSAALSGDSSSASSYQWSYMSPSGATSSDVSSLASPQFTFTSSGTYTVWVQITDAAGGTVTGVRALSVSASAAPEASFGYSSQTSVPVPGAAVIFTSTSSASSSQSITSTTWTFGDGSSASGAAASHTYAASGTYTVTLHVTQTGGQSSQTTKSITVANPPTATIGWSTASPTADSAVSFTSAAAAGAGSIAIYHWSFGDGESSSSADPSHSYTSAATNTVTLTVTQTDGLTDTVTRTITVAAALAGSGGSAGSTSASGSSSSGSSSSKTSGTSDSSGSGGSSSSSGASRSTGSSCAPATPAAALTQALSGSPGALKIENLLRTGAATSTVAAASATGAITITWYSGTGKHRLVVARGAAAIRSGAAARITVRLTAAGRALLRRSGTLRVSVAGRYDFGATSVTGTRTLTLRR